MPTHLYCLLPAESDALAPPPPDVRAVAVRGMIAWVSDAGAPRLSRDVRDAARATLDHDRVIGTAIARGITPVPSTLADPYESDAAALADLEGHAEAIAAALRAVQGAVEMTTIVAMDDAPGHRGSSGRGRAYLEHLRDLPHQAAATADRVEQTLRTAGGVARRRAQGGRVALSHLVPRKDVARYREAAQACVGKGYRVVVDGPRAPYSFASFAPGRGMTAPLPGAAA